MRANIVGLLAVALAERRIHQQIAVLVQGPHLVLGRPADDHHMLLEPELLDSPLALLHELGPLVPGDIIAWNLMAVGPDQVPPGGVSCGLGCGISATLSDLEFTSTSLLNDTILQTADATTHAFLLFFEGGIIAGIPITGASTEMLAIAPYEIGTAQASEPGTLTLLVPALAGLNFVRKRSRGRQSAVV